MRYVNPYEIKLNEFTELSSIDTVKIIGKKFLKCRKLYLSASNIEAFENLTYFNPFSSSVRMQTLYPAFSGIEVENFYIESDKILYFDFPELPKKTCFIDVILENEAGYGKLTIDSRMPFISSFQGAIDIQHPWVNGIIADIRVLY